MRQPTEMMRSILTDETAQKLIDYVSPIYGNSYVGLWMFQAIGSLLGEVRGICEQLMYETTPATSVLLLDYWEDHYGIARDRKLTVEQRQARILAKIQSRGPCNPMVLASAVSTSLGGVPVEINEHVAKNTFLVNIRENVEDITPAVAVIERMKPAHMIYNIRMAMKMVSDADIKVAIALVHSESYNVEVQS